jgi:uncharacterized protein (DUF2345 family)
MQRDKGKRGELEVANLFKAAGFDARRPAGQSFAGSDAADVAVHRLPHLWVECKRGKKTNVRAAIRQAETACKSEQWPIAVTRDDQEKQAVVAMRWDVFAALLKKAYPEAVNEDDKGRTFSEDGSESA